MNSDVTPPKPRLRPKSKNIEPLPKPDAAPLHEQAKAVEPSFKTPAQPKAGTYVTEIAAQQPADTDAQIVEHETPKKKWLNWHWQWPPTRKQGIAYGIVVILLAAGIGTGWTLTHRSRAIEASTPKKSQKATPKPVIYSTLSGLPVSDVSVNQRSVTAVMIENSLDARPQSGLSSAGVVFEAVAEGGVTRYVALFQDTVPTNVGPIRSARPYYVQWAMGFDAAYAHVGGSPDALQDIAAWGTKDMNQFSNGGSYHRTDDRPAPHNVYTGIDTLAQLEASKGFGASSYAPFARKSDKPYKAPTAGAATPSSTQDTRTAANSIDFKLSGYTYDPHYDYNAATDSYNRSEAGEPQTDANTGQQLSPKVVVAIVVPLGRGALDSSGAYYSDYNVIGSGQAYVFQDGTVTTATWQKADTKTNISFTDSTGKPLTFNRGQTWISAVSSTAGVSYQ